MTADPGTAAGVTTKPLDDSRRRVDKLGRVLRLSGYGHKEGVRVGANSVSPVWGLLRLRRMGIPTGIVTEPANARPVRGRMVFFNRDPFDPWSICRPNGFERGVARALTADTPEGGSEIY